MSETDSDLDEPPTKISKIKDVKPIEEEHLEADEEDEMGEGQEEWLSEGILTDDDYNAGTEQETLDPSLTSACENSQLSQDDETPSLEDSTEQETLAEDKGWTAPIETREAYKALNESTPAMTVGVETHSILLDQGVKSEDHQLISSTTKNDVQNIEDALNSFETKTELTDVLETFLIRKPGVKVEVKEAKKETSAVEQQNDDGNDTDELLRLLGDDDSKLKKKVLVKKSTKKEVKAEDSSDDEFNYELAASVKTIRVARNVLMKERPAPKAVPEDLSDGGNYAASSDETSTVKKIFGMTAKKSTRATTTIKNTTNSSMNQTRPPVKHVVQINKPLNSSSNIVHSTPKQYMNKSLQVKEPVVTVKPAIKVQGKPTTTKTQANLKITTVNEIVSKSSDRKQHVLRSSVKSEIMKPVVKLETLKPSVKLETMKPAVKLATMKPAVKLENLKPAVKLETMKPVVKLETMKPVVKLETLQPSLKLATSKPAIKLETSKPVIKFETSKPIIKFETSKPVVKLYTSKPTIKFEASKPVVKLGTSKPIVKSETIKKSQPQENEEIINEEEFLEEDEDYNLDEEEFCEESDMEEGSRKQRIMRPERMDEEVPSDADSHSEDGSLYDEIPSSDSEDMDDWFTLDIRAERAGDYLPLLGPKARELLMEEKKRVSVRLATLRQSLSALTENGRKHAEQMRQATMSLAELDDMLKAT